MIMNAMRKIKTVEDSDEWECCGCFLCEVICPVHAITDRLAFDGFKYPQVNHIACIGCGKCLAVCPMRKGGEESLS